MKALTLHQPFAWAVSTGLKRIENRGWDTRYRGPLLIHAGLKMEYEEFDRLDASGYTTPEEVHVGAYVAVVELADVITEAPAWDREPFPFRGPYGFVLKHAVALEEPLDARGRLGMWSPSASEISRVLMRLPRGMRSGVEARMRSADGLPT